MNLYVVECHYHELTEEMAQIRPTHRKYVEELFEAGHVIAAGRAQNSESAAGLFIVKAENELGARDQLEKDVFVTGGFVRDITVRHWDLAFGSVSGISPEDLQR